MGQCGSYAKPKQAEITAIHACCIDAIQRNIHGNIAIYSDSAVALSTLANSCIDSALVLECIQMLKQLAEHSNVKLIWLPAHAGIYGNEVADSLAKQASRRLTVGPEPITAIDYTLVKKINEEGQEQQTAQMWSSEKGCSHTKCFINGANSSITEQLLNMSKPDIRIVTGLLTGHCRVNQHLVRLGLRDDPDCDLCGKTAEVARHIVCDCDTIAPIRKNVYNTEHILPREVTKFPLRKLVEFYKKGSEQYNHLSQIF